MLSAALAAALVVGSIGAAPIVALAGFETAILVTIIGLALATLVALTDRRLAPTAAAAPAAPDAG